MLQRTTAVAEAVSAALADRVVLEASVGPEGWAVPGDRPVLVLPQLEALVAPQREAVRARREAARQAVMQRAVTLL